MTRGMPSMLLVDAYLRFVGLPPDRITPISSGWYVKVDVGPWPLEEVVWLIVSDRESLRSEAQRALAHGAAVRLDDHERR